MFSIFKKRIMLSLTEGNPIAKVVKSKAFKPKKGKFKYLGIVQYDDKKVMKGADPYLLYNEDEIEDMVKSRKPKEIRKKMKELVGSKDFKERQAKTFVLNDGELEPIPDTEKERDVLYCSGPSGAGKSTIIGKFLKNYADIYPDNHIYLMSAVAEDDEAFKELEIIRLPLDRDYLEEVLVGDGLVPEYFQNSAVIFDDVDTIACKKMRDHVLSLRDGILQTGRHYNTTICCTTHQICNYKSTKILIQEASKIIVFPNSGSSYHIRRFLEVYCNLKGDKKMVEKIMALPSRWVMISKTSPTYVLYRDGAFML